MAEVRALPSIECGARLLRGCTVFRACGCEKVAGEGMIIDRILRSFLIASDMSFSSHDVISSLSALNSVIDFFSRLTRSSISISSAFRFFRDYLFPLFY